MQETNTVEIQQAPPSVQAAVAAEAPTATLISYGAKLTRAELARVRTPAGTATHKPIPHIEVVERLTETLGFRQIGVVRDEYAVSSDGMRMFGVMDLTTGFEGCRFAIGLRNSHDKSFRLSCTVGLRCFVCENLAFHGDYTPVLAKHSKNFSLQDSLAIGVDRMQRNFGPLQQQVEVWQSHQLSTATAKLVIYQAFIENALEAPKHLARRVREPHRVRERLAIARVRPSDRPSGKYFWHWRPTSVPTRRTLGLLTSPYCRSPRDSQSRTGTCRRSAPRAGWAQFYEYQRTPLDSVVPPGESEPVLVRAPPCAQIAAVFPYSQGHRGVKFACRQLSIQ